MKQIIISLIPLLFIALFIFAGIEFEIWRWHLFESVTHSKISFWEYTLLFGHK